MSSVNEIEDLEAQIAALEREIAERPKRMQEEFEQRMCTIPASDEVLHQQRERVHELDLTKNQVRNIRISQTKDGALLILIIVAIIAASFWIYNALQAV